jgi:hypothetical protein
MVKLKQRLAIIGAIVFLTTVLARTGHAAAQGTPAPSPQATPSTPAAQGTPLPTPTATPIPTEPPVPTDGDTIGTGFSIQAKYKRVGGGTRTVTVSPVWFEVGPELEDLPDGEPVTWDQLVAMDEFFASGLRGTTEDWLAERYPDDFEELLEIISVTMDSRLPLPTPTPSPKPSPAPAMPRTTGEGPPSATK